jgi:CheY-like chemotaxis protein
MLVWFQLSSRAQSAEEVIDASLSDDIPRKTGQPNRILVVEDEADIRRVITWLLEDVGYEVEQAGNGQEAVDRLMQGQSKIPDVILLDLLMPVMGGDEFLKWQRASPQDQIRNIPVVVTTGVAELPTAVIENADIILRKPVEAAVLTEAILRSHRMAKSRGLRRAPGGT